MDSLQTWMGNGIVEIIRQRVWVGDKPVDVSAAVDIDLVSQCNNF